MWDADGAEYSDLHHHEQHVCFWCECPKNKLGEYVPPDKQHPRWDHNLYRTLGNANSRAANAELSSRHVHGGLNQFQYIPCIVSVIPKPNLLHSIQIGMLDHLPKWIFHITKMHKQQDMYNAIWSSVPAYHDLTPRNMSYEEVPQ